ncbi:hypothetical protein BABINDRAFT_43257 [Babjeviella inositovora NRRL Y-12698]|uniref:SWIB domain-containing protein n=1 Tax=Babjeviella inositovora NRRL Y-12698 TaxID=984486 RepID=A0A1E3QXT6_9ASCO|nr:uncharacterized protein BABINDRAFT_43257 [Babjeviella inositovora NRRL Y-12698]ODQ82466.1 hypothetical protein BABINDRAFT_43257 [Babjeviella inositovora NRRL Y-12698]
MTISHKPTDLTIPRALDDLIPEVALYRKLAAAENKIDAFTQRKWLDLQEYLNKPLEPETLLLRVYVYNTCENQPWQQADGTAASKWTLRVEGRLVGGNAKFSLMLTGLTVDLMPNPNYPDIGPQNSNHIIEWHENTPESNTNVGLNAKLSAFDGLDITRTGQHPIACKVTLQLKELPLKMKVSAPLAQILGAPEMSQHGVIYGIWQYIQLHGLFLPPTQTDTHPVATREPGDDLRTVYCDATLFSLFGLAKFKFPRLMELLTPHLSPKEPIVIDYEVDVTKASTLGSCVVDIPVELSVYLAAVRAEQLETIKHLYHVNDHAIMALNNKISTGVAVLNQSRAKQQFYAGLAENPVDFLQDWYASHCHNLKILNGDEGFSEETMRRADFFANTNEEKGLDGEALLRDNVALLFNTNRL